MPNRFHRRYVTSEIYAREIVCPKCFLAVHYDYTTDKINELRLALARARGMARRYRTNFGKRLEVQDRAILRAKAELDAEAVRVGLPDRAT